MEKSHTDLGRKNSHRKKSHKKESRCFFFYLMLEIGILYSIKYFVWVDVLRPDKQFSVMPGRS